MTLIEALISDLFEMYLKHHQKNHNPWLLVAVFQPRLVMYLALISPDLDQLLLEWLLVFLYYLAHQMPQEQPLGQLRIKIKTFLFSFDTNSYNNIDTKCSDAETWWFNYFKNSMKHLFKHLFLRRMECGCQSVRYTQNSTPVFID